MTNFPTSIDTFTKPNPNDPRSGTTSLSTFYGNAVDSISALEAKVGINSSADTTSMDYKLSGVPVGGKAASLTGTEVFTNKTLTAPKINVGSDTTGDMYYRDGSGLFQRLPAGADGTIVSYASGLPVVVSNPAAAIASYTVAGVRKLDANAGYYGADSGTTNTYVITLSPALNAYAVGQDFTFKASSANTGACTININGLGAKSIVKGVSTALVAGDIANGQTVTILYDGTNFILQTPSGNTGLFVGNKIALSATPVTVTNTNAETTLGTISIPASTLGTGNGLKLKYILTQFNMSGSTSVVFRLKYGSTTIATATISSSYAGGGGLVDVTLMATGTTNAQTGSVLVMGASTSAAVARAAAATGTATEDSTTILNLSVTVQFASSSPSDTITTSGYFVEKIS